MTTIVITMSEMIDNIAKLKTQVEKYKELTNIQKDHLDKQRGFIETLQHNIKIMKPFVELTKTLKEDNPRLWEHYVSKTVENRNK